MKLALTLILVFSSIPVIVTADALAQTHSTAAQSLAELRAQLVDVQAKEDALQQRARQLDEALKPENIERSLAGVGSTKPEELRELRRKQLTVERESVRSQLNLLATSRERLESSIRTAESAAYQQSAEGFATPLSQSALAQNTFSSSTKTIGTVSGGIALAGLILVIGLVRRAARRSH